MKTVGLSAQVPGRGSRFLLACVFLVLVFSDASVITRAWYDFKVQSLVPADSARDSVVIIDIDDATLNAVGRWPWPRADFAALLSMLTENYQPKQVVVNFLFPEPSDSDDSALIALAQDPRFVFAVAFDFESDRRLGDLPKPEASQSVSLDQSMTPATGWVGMHTALANGVPGAQIGHVNLSEDPDGVVRRIPGWVIVDHAVYPSLPQQVLTTSPHAEALAHREALIPYVRDPRQMMTVSALDILSGAVPVELLADRILLVGTSASGLANRVVIPLGFAVPGILVQGLTIEAWQAGEIWDQRPLVTGILFWGGLSVLLVGVLYLGRLATTQTLLVVLGLGVLVLGVNWLDHAVWTAVWDPTTMTLALFSLAVAQAYHLFELQKLATSRVRDMFESYVPETVVDTLLSGDLDRFDRGERVRVTVLFADLVGFTALAERSPPDELTATVRHVFNTLTAVILDCGGTVDKYMGDAVMAFWGAPLPDEHQEAQAVKCAIQMQDAIAALPYGLKLSIGVNTGMATVGNMGSDFRHAYSVLGDTVNVAARLESQTRAFEKNILLGAETASGCSVPTQSMGEIWVKGKQESIEVFCVRL